MHHVTLVRGWILGVSLAFAFPVSAQESNPAPLPPADDAFHAEWRARGIGVGEYPLDAAGTTMGQSAYAEHRLRLSAFFKNGPVAVTADADLTNGLLVGDTADEPFPFVAYRRDRFGGLADASSVFLRQLSMEATTPLGVARVGHMPSRWGLGLVANDGAGVPDWGDHYFADVVERAFFGTRPFARGEGPMSALVVGAGADIVFRDQTADLVRGDRAYQGVATVLWAPAGSSSRAGVYAVRRTQVDRDGYYMRVWVIDGHARWHKEAGPMSFHLEGEFARVFGETNTVRDIYETSRAIDQLGAAFEIGAGFGGSGEEGPRRVEAIVQAGYASGDDRPHDGRLTGFKFDPEYNVGFILFEEVLAWQTAASARSVADPDIFGRPAPGARFLPTEGAVTNATYVMPTVRYSPFPALTMRAATLVARADRPLDDPWQTMAMHGGVRHTAMGSTTTSRDLGVEVDLGARYTWTRAKRPSISADLQIGRFLPGDAFVDEAGEKMDPVDRLLAGVTLAW